MDKEKKPVEERLRLLALVEGNVPAGRKEKTDSRFVWPDLVFKELLAGIGILVLLIIWSLLIDAPLGPEADASWTENPAKAPWYFLGLQELLVYFDPWLAGVVIPTLILVGLMVIPYIDVSNPISGEYRILERKKASALFLFGFFLWFVLIIVGTFLRGPSWHFYWPWESWAIAKHAGEALWSLHWSAGVAFLGVFFLGGYLLLTKIYKELVQRLGIIRYMIIVFLLLFMLFVPVKIGLRLLFNIKYILITPYFNI